MPKMLPELHSSPAVRRWNNGAPVLSKEHIPYEAECIFNAGVAKYQGRYVMIFRNDYRYDAARHGFGFCNLGIAFSRDGIHWEVEKRPFFSAERLGDPEITRIYDPRVTVIDGICYVCFAVDTKHGVRGGIAMTDDFEHIRFLSLSAPDNRNMVLFPEKIGGRYWRLERPFPVYSRGGVDRFDMWISASPDLRYWGDTDLVLAVEDVPWANDKIGPGAPPVKTGKGWLVLFHAVDRDRSRGKNGWEPVWQKRYCAGVMLLDLENPAKTIGLSREPLLAPETAWECDEGFRTNTIFPGGLIAEDSGELKIYYGASDTVECLAFADINELVELCKPL
ncbi:MAG: glycoside hydrolase family 130 protein [Treponema sp.]|jgi:beta-1,4-mannooligosaccharide/beta-1,4-mannosyl-N-acetylglucosamine phosphorylase|nr:glycoside hydrolase family 130 protein [Treponema sp.]